MGSGDGVCRLSTITVKLLSRKFPSSPHINRHVWPRPDVTTLGSFLDGDNGTNKKLLMIIEAMLVFTESSLREELPTGNWIVNRVEQALDSSFCLQIVKSLMKLHPGYCAKAAGDSLSTVECGHASARPGLFSI